LKRDQLVRCGGFTRHRFTDCGDDFCRAGGRRKNIVEIDWPLVLKFHFRGHFPTTAEIARDLLGNAFQRAVRFDNRMRIGPMIKIQKAMRLRDVADDVRLPFHHHDHQFGFVTAFGEQPAGETRKIIAIAAPALEKSFRVLQFRVQLELESREGANQVFRRQILSFLKRADRARARDGEETGCNPQNQNQPAAM